MCAAVERVRGRDLLILRTRSIRPGDLPPRPPAMPRPSTVHASVREIGGAREALVRRAPAAAPRQGPRHRQRKGGGGGLPLSTLHTRPRFGILPFCLWRHVARLRKTKFALPSRPTTAKIRVRLTSGYPRGSASVGVEPAARRPRRAGRSDWPRGVALSSQHDTLGDFWSVATMATMATPADQPLKKRQGKSLFGSSWLVITPPPLASFFFQVSIQGWPWWPSWPWMCTSAAFPPAASC